METRSARRPVARRGSAAARRAARAAPSSPGLRPVRRRRSRQLPEQLPDAELHLRAQGVGRTDAARATLGAGAGREMLAGPLEEWLRRAEQALREADAA